MSNSLSVGVTIICINNSPFKNTNVAPPLVVGETYVINEILLDSKGNPHYDVGLKSHYSFVSSQETGEELDRGDKIHWCHPSRFKLYV